MLPQSLPKALSAVAVLGLSPVGASAEESSQGLPPDTTPVTVDTTYLRLAPAADYWAFEPFVPAQMSNCASAIAALTAVLNGMTSQSIQVELTQQIVLGAMTNDTWSALVAEDGGGITFSELVDLAAEAFAATGNRGFSFTPFRPEDDSDASFARLHALLEANEHGAGDALIVYFDQGVLTGGKRRPHTALIGAYDLISERVLILEVDRENHIPYWTSTESLLEAMLQPASAEHGRLAGETGGLLHIHLTK